jgi:hypothetical protein
LPRIIDYPTVRDTLLAQGLVSLYHNSGAFGFPESASARHVGWVGPPDPTIRPAARALARHVPPPFERNLAELAAVAWQQHLPGAAWVMPKSHWAYELDFGSREWMPGLLQSIDVDAGVLITRNDGSALEFEPNERDAFVRVVEGLLARLLGSDFALAFPGRSALCTVHHHKQLWWSSSDASTMAALDRLVPSVTEPEE